MRIRILPRLGSWQEGSEDAKLSRRQEGGETRAGDNRRWKGRQKYTSEHREPTRFAALYNLIHSRIMWKTLVVDPAGLPAKHTFEKLQEAPCLLHLGRRAGQRSKQEKTLRKHISLPACRRKLFSTGKCKPLPPAREHGGFTSLIIAVRFLSVNSKLLTYKISSVFRGKAKTGDGEMSKSSK